MNQHDVLKQFDDLCDRFEASWIDGDEPAIEVYLAEAAAVSRDRLFRELLLLDLAYRSDGGKSLTLDEYVARHPMFEEAVRKVFDDIAAGRAVRSTLRSADTDADVRQLPAIAPTDVPGYEIFEPLGRGGMAIVYKARHKRLNRLVALKRLLTGSHATVGEAARFRAEAEAAAKLQHPNIVQVFDVFEYENCLYISLELIEHGTLGKLIGGKPQPPALAADLVRQIAEAVEVAHQHGIIHRDLKPSNILLTADNTPKITDFGLAKRLESDVAQTQTGDVLGTPSYMPPEQALGRNSATAPTNDVYALGAVLYELLTGHAPFVGATAWETVAQVIHDDPVRPVRLQPKLPRDLETICLKCLEKEPRRRYQSAAELVDELQRFSSGRPITARPASAAMRAWKWCRRNPAIAGLSAVATIALIAGTITSSILAVQARRSASLANDRLDEVQIQKGLTEQALREVRQANAEAVAALNDSERARTRAEAVTQFISQALRSPEPGRDGRNVTVAETLDQAVKQARANLRDDPETYAHVLNTIGRTYINLGLAHRSVELHREALELQDGGTWSSPAVMCETLSLLGASLGLLGRVKEAIPLLERAVSLTTPGNDIPARQRADAMSDLAAAYLRTGRLDDSFTMTQRSFEFCKATFGDNQIYTIAARESLANMYQWRGDLPRSIELQERALEQRREMFGDGSYQTLDTMHFLAIAYRAAGRIDEAIALHTRTLELKTNQLSAEHPSTLNTAMYLGVAYTSAGRFNDAIRMHEPTLEARRRTLGAAHPDTLDSMHHLGVAYHLDGRLDEAIELLQTTVEQRRRVLGTEHRYTMSSIYCLASAYMTAERHDDCDKQMSACIDLFREVRTEEQPAALSLLVRASLAQGRIAEAETLCRELLMFCEAHMPDHWQCSGAKSLLGECLLERGALDEAEPLLREGHSGLQARAAKLAANAQLLIARAAEQLDKLRAKRAAESGDSRELAR